MTPGKHDPNEIERNAESHTADAQTAPAGDPVQARLDHLFRQYGEETEEGFFRSVVNRYRKVRTA